MTREQAIEIAQMCAKAKPQDYYMEPVMKVADWAVWLILLSPIILFGVALLIGFFGGSTANRGTK